MKALDICSQHFSVVPALNSQLNQKNPLVYLQIAVGNLSWFVMEYGSEDGGTFLGYAPHEDDSDCSPVGYYNIPEILYPHKGRDLVMQVIEPPRPLNDLMDFYRSNTFKKESV